MSEQGKDQLIRLKRITGIKQWNVLCRWALCLSLADPSLPLVRSIKADSNVEMSWRTFAGPIDVPLAVLLRQRFASEASEFESLFDMTAAHLHRGIGQMAGLLQLGDGIDGLLALSRTASASGT